MEGETVQAYLQRRECVLSRMHPNWATVYDHDDGGSGKRLICIPPSWDLIRMYTGTIPHYQPGSADFKPSVYNVAKCRVAGERGEEDFLRRMQDSAVAIDGLLIGNIDGREIVNGNRYNAVNKQNKVYVMPKTLSNRVRQDPAFEMDFVLIHPRIGFYQIEVKFTTKPNNVNSQIANGADQIQRGTLQKLFGAFCEANGQFEWSALWQRYNASGAVYLSDRDSNPVDGIRLRLEQCMKKSKKIEVNVIFQDIAGHFEGLELVERLVSSHETLAAYFRRMKKITWQRRRRQHRRQFNYFYEEVLFRQFAVFLSTYRPDFYISPMLCVLKVHKNLITQCLQTVNYYKKSTVGSTRQNRSKPAIEYLRELQQKRLIQNCNVKFLGRTGDIYFTEEQLTATAVLTETNNGYCFTNMKQLIMGPPGSGKSLIVMMKLFILAQLRSNIPLVCVTWKAHSEVMQKFTKVNCILRQNGFQRKIQIESDLQRFEGTFFDCVLDEQFPKPQLYPRFRNDISDNRISVAVVTGGLRLINDGDNRLSNLVQPTVLQTSFRSTNAIQQYLVQTMQLPISMVCGHSFEGIKPEIYDYDSEQDAVAALEERVRTLSLHVQEQDEIENGIVLLTTKSWLFSDEVFDVVTVYNPSIVPSLEFLIVIIFGDRAMKYQLLAASRAICHLIMYTYDDV